MVRQHGISIHALREEGDDPETGDLVHVDDISIHALREEGDSTVDTFKTLRRISIHALREEGDIQSEAAEVGLSIFLSTPSARRATLRSWSGPPGRNHFYPRPPRGGRQALPGTVIGCWVFLSTPSARRATPAYPGGDREENYFYPRPPRGGRQQKRRKTSPLLFHYKTICTDLEELVQKHPKKQLRPAQNGLKTWCEGDGKRVSAFHSHRGNRLEDQHVSGFKQGMHPDVLDLGLIVVAQLIKP